MNPEQRKKAGLQLVKKFTWKEDKNTTWILTQSIWKSSKRNLWEMKCISYGKVIPSTKKSWIRLPKDIREMFKVKTEKK